MTRVYVLLTYRVMSLPDLLYIMLASNLQASMQGIGQYGPGSSRPAKPTGLEPAKEDSSVVTAKLDYGIDDVLK